MEQAMKDFHRQLGGRLREVRVIRGISQKALGEMVGISFQQVQKYESGVNSPSPARLKLLAQKLDLSIGYLFGEKETALADLGDSHRRTLDIVQALHRLEQSKPMTFARLCSFIITLA